MEYLVIVAFVVWTISVALVARRDANKEWKRAAQTTQRIRRLGTTFRVRYDNPDEELDEILDRIDDC